jgi:beta-lactamase superfamily II metal-dependent hydrolase
VFRFTGATEPTLFATPAIDYSRTRKSSPKSTWSRLDLGTTRVLFMGDAQAGGRADPSTAPDPGSIEGALLSCCASELAAQVMVVGHHGSKTSSRKAFLDAVGACTFIVSSGPKKYGPVTRPDDGSHRLVECRPATPTSMGF